MTRWIEIANLVALGAFPLIGWTAAYMRGLRGRIESTGEAVDKRLDDHAVRLARLEATQEATDVQEELGKVHRRVDQIASSTSKIEGALQQSNRLLDTIHKHLLNRD